jgi:hypothetical protein
MHRGAWLLATHCRRKEARAAPRRAAPSALPWISGVQPGPDGIDIWFAQAGMYRLLVLMSADAARTGRAATFELGLRLRR